MKNLPALLVMLALAVPLNIWGVHWTAEGDAQDPPGRIGPLVYNSSTAGLYGGMVSYDDVALIVNDNSPASKEIGGYFALLRGIPRERIINITAPNQETINPSQFDDLANQVKDSLRTRGLTDSINYLVTTTGVPLRVSGNNWRMASVDEELMLLDGPYEADIHGNYWIENPYFDGWRPFNRSYYGIRLVTRLTGYTIEEAKGLVDLANASLGVRGRALLDMDPGKGYQPSGYGLGNYWMIGAHDWLTENGHESLLDDNYTFRTGWTNTSAYYSWGSNDGDWGKWLLQNSDFEGGTGAVPNAWTLYQYSGSAERTTESFDGGAYSLKMTRTSAGSTLLAEQYYDVGYPDHRFIFDGRAHLLSVGARGARAFAQGFNATGGIVYYKEFYNRTGTRDWEGFQGVIENRSDMVRIRICLELDEAGTVYWDNVALRVIRPHNQWVPGAIAETCVSTGGRSMTYGTWYGQSLVVDLVRDGVTGVKGYVYEPFLTAMSHADIMIPSYYSGYSLAEAFWMGSQLGSWMGTVIGDPKCTPYVNVRADMGFGPVPLITSVDSKGRPYLTLSLFNKGMQPASNGLVELYMDGALLDSRKVMLPPGSGLNVTYAYEDMNADIQGPHMFKVVLNSDRSVWEYDASNDIWEEAITVDSMPSMAIEVMEGLQVVRTHRGLFNVTLMDPDMDMPELGPDVTVLGPSDEPMPKVLLEYDDIEGGRVYRYAIDISWDDPIGFYEILASYVDPAGSPTSARVKAAIRAVNALPTMEGSLSANGTRRGKEVLLNLTWADEDTPDGGLDVSATVTGLPWVHPQVGGPVFTSNNSCTYSIMIPPEHTAQQWSVSAKVADRDSGSASWSGTFSTWNGGPSIAVTGGVPGDYTQLDVVPLVFNYTDPEGQDPSSFAVEVVLQVTPEMGTVLQTFELEPTSGVPYSLAIACRDLPLASLDVRLTCEDDEGERFTITVHDAISLHNIPVNLTLQSIQFRNEPADPGDPLMRGDLLTVYVLIDDPDDSGTGVLAAGRVMRSDEAVQTFDMDWKGSKLYTGRVPTSRDWVAGTYWIEIAATDDAEETTLLTIDPAFVLTTSHPTIDSGLIKVDAWNKMNVSVALVPGAGLCYPTNVTIHIWAAGGLEARYDLSPSSSGLVWSFSGPAPFLPNGSMLEVVDDTGRTTEFNGTLAIDLPGPVVGPEDQDAGGGMDALMVAMLGLLVLLVALVVAAVMVLITRRKGRGMVPAPMNPVPGLAPDPVLSALPGGPSGILAGQLPPGLPPSELLDGSIYHPPAPKASPPQVPSRPVSADVIPEPPQPPDPPAPLAGEGLKNEEMIEPPVQDVRDTDGPHLPGDN